MAVVTGTVIAGAGVAASAYGGNRARKQSRQQMQAAERAQQEQVAAMRELQGEARERYEEWRSTFMPAIGRMGELAMQEARPDYEQIDADVGMSFDMAQQQRRRQQERFGLNPGDGESAASEREYGIGRALATVGGRNVARRNAQDQQWQRLAGFAGMGEGMRSGADGLMAAAYGGVASAFGGQANSNFNMAAQSQNRADAAFNDAASGLGYLGQGFANRSNAAQPSIGAAGMPSSYRAPPSAGVSAPNMPTGPIYNPRPGGG